MPRDINGNYTLPLPAVQGGTVISSAWANTTLDDIALSLTNSLDRTGNGGMLSPFLNQDGNLAAPGISWANEPSSGFYRAGPSDMRVALLGIEAMRWDANGAFLWNRTTAQWDTVLTNGGVEQLVAVPQGTADAQILVWDESGNQEWVLGTQSGGGTGNLPNGTADGQLLRWDSAAGGSWAGNSVILVSDNQTVGIGEAPISTAILKVAQDASLMTVAWDNTNGLNTDDILHSYRFDGDEQATMAISRNAGDTGGEISFSTGVGLGGQAVRMKISSIGNVGIGIDPDANNVLRTDNGAVQFNLDGASLEGLTLKQNTGTSIIYAQTVGGYSGHMDIICDIFKVQLEWASNTRFSFDNVGVFRGLFTGVGITQRSSKFEVVSGSPGADANTIYFVVP